MKHLFSDIYQTPIIMLVFLSFGCRQPLDTSYAKPRGPSINGISTFIQALRATGQHVDLIPFLNPNLLKKHRLLVIFHNSFDPLSQKTIDGLDQIIESTEVKTILLILRDKDTTEDYWAAIVDGNQLTPERQVGAKGALDLAKRDSQIQSPKAFSLKTGDFYGREIPIRTKADDKTPIRILVGDEEKYVVANWPLIGRLIPANSACLWQKGTESVLTETHFSSVNLLIMASAYPLLNAGLVDPGNRILCEQLIAKLEPMGRIAVAISSRWVDAGGQEESEEQGIAKFLWVQPFPWIFTQVMLAIVLFCWWKSPIIGRPRVTSNGEVRQFRSHVDALGDLLSYTKGMSFVMERIREWQKYKGNKSKRNNER